MGGRIHGFLGGVLLTSAFTYYTGQYFQKNQQVISHHLKTSNNIINNRILSDKDISTEIVPVDSRINYTSRPNIAETSKDIWNDEIIKMVNWIYSINWYQWMIDADKTVHNLKDKVSTAEKK
ncbi:hypothetical protein HYPBUDRAFT_153077 [Hyphopichia burtonii NRRL Y-1933]|uniref:MICOS complex subunit MIC12 n=1 Tax=Hyphopichia burtonii NRRL Y-1933 TaxID=984485 RepID=A0A1E4RJC0_9ASCO|nr:hypothetical protein HYPBUDRAFT_153077 [Hyphopichia burtonii NRRL Y-1933]ODV67185.1 hypothetical protein HYPBUDRAFT_153077 [Hyphopichia burtonii NRRL Y-1933]